MMFRSQPNFWRIGSIESFKGIGSVNRDSTAVCCVSTWPN